MAAVTSIIPCRTLAHYPDTYLAPEACLLSLPCLLLARVWELFTSLWLVADGVSLSALLVWWPDSPLG